MFSDMRGRLDSETRWLRLLLACLAVGSTVSPAQVASAVEPVCVAQGGRGKKPVELVARVEARVGHPALSIPNFTARAWSPPLRPLDPRPPRPARFLLHRALLN
jgi:hypothetical protein